MPKFGQVLGTECENLSACRGLIYFWRRGGSENSYFVTSNVYALKRRILHAGHPYHPLSNELKQTNTRTNKQTNPGNMGGICGCVKRPVKRFDFVLFIHHCKTVIKADQKSFFYPPINDILYQKYLKKR